MLIFGGIAISNLIGNFNQHNDILVLRNDYEELERRVQLLEARRKYSAHLLFKLS